MSETLERSLNPLTAEAPSPLRRSNAILKQDQFIRP